MKSTISVLSEQFAAGNLDALKESFNGCKDSEKGARCCQTLNIPLIKDHPRGTQTFLLNIAVSFDH